MLRTGHDQHKARRATLNRFFSTASVRRLQPIIAERVQILIERLRDRKNVNGDAGVIKVGYAFAAFTNGKLLIMELFQNLTISESSSKLYSLTSLARRRYAILLRLFRAPTRTRKFQPQIPRRSLGSRQRWSTR